MWEDLLSGGVVLSYIRKSSSGINRFEVAQRWICDFFVILFGLWTILTNLAVLEGVGFRQLRLASIIVPILGSIAIYWLLFRNRQGLSPETPYEPPTSDFAPTLGNYMALVLAGTLAIFYLISSSYVLCWVLSILFLGVYYFKDLSKSSLILHRAKHNGWRTSLVVMMALIAMVLTSLAHRPDADDSFFVNIAVGALETPDLPLLKFDTMHGVPGWPIVLTSYRSHSLELLTAMISYITGLEPIEVAHLVLPVFFAALVIVAATRLLCILLPNCWPYALFAFVIIFMVHGDQHQSYGNFGFVRLFQGKAVLVSLIVPIMTVYAIEFFVSRSISKWVLLALSQVCAVGMTTNGIFVAPVTVGLTLISCWKPSRKNVKFLLAGFMSSFYPIFLGLYFRSQFVEGIFDANSGTTIPNPQECMNKVMGTDATLWFFIVALIGAWTVLSNQSLRRLLLGVAFWFILMFMNPFLYHFWANNLTGHFAFWRILWAVPLTAWLAVLMTSAIHVRSSQRVSLMGFFIFLSVLGLFVALVPKRYTFSMSNGTSLEMPRLKVPHEDYEIVKQITSLLGKNYTVLAPTEISLWTTTILNHPYPVISRPHYLEQLRPRVNGDEVDRRLALQKFINNPCVSSSEIKLLERSLSELNIGAVVIKRGPTAFPHFESVLARARFQPFNFVDCPHYTIYYSGNNTLISMRPDLTTQTTLAKEFNGTNRIVLLINPEEGTKGINPNNQVSVVHNSQGIVLRSVGSDPQIMLPDFSAQPEMSYVMLIDITPPANTELQVFYTTSDSSDFTEDRSYRFCLIEGRNEVYVSLKDHPFGGKLRIDPGMLPGDYLLHRLEIREKSTSGGSTVQ